MKSFLKSGPVAQLGARFHGMEEVTGSIPVRSTNKHPKNQELQIQRDGVLLYPSLTRKKQICLPVLVSRESGSFSRLERT